VNVGTEARATSVDVAEHPELDAYLRVVRATFPQIDPLIEEILVLLEQANKYIEGVCHANMHHVGLTKEEFKVLIALRIGSLSHGTLSRELDVSTGAMTNRLDKLEHAGLIARSRDPHDRRGVLLELTPDGREKLDEYIELGAARERELLTGLSDREKQQLVGLLRKLAASLRSELGPSDLLLARVDAAVNPR